MNLTEAYDALLPANEKAAKEWSAMRHVILTSQVGDLGRFTSHDPELNPHGTRPQVSREEELTTFGEVLGNALMYMQARGFSAEDCVEGVEMALEKMVDQDWKASQAAEDGSIQGKVANDFDGITRFTKVRGVVAKLEGSDISYLPDAHNMVLVIEHFRPEHTWLASQEQVAAIVTDHGGMSSHAAKICREVGTPCIVSTGNASAELDVGDEVVLDMETGKVEKAEPSSR